MGEDVYGLKRLLYSRYTLDSRVQLFSSSYMSVCRQMDRLKCDVISQINLSVKTELYISVFSTAEKSKQEPQEHPNKLRLVMSSDPARTTRNSRISLITC